MKPIDFIPVVMIVIVVAGICTWIAQAQDSVLPPPTQPPGMLHVGSVKGPLVLRATTVWLPVEPVAVDVEVIVEFDGNRSLIVLWSDGSVTQPDYALPRALAPSCPADINGDGKVGVPDWLIMLEAWGMNCPE